MSASVCKLGLTSCRTTIMATKTKLEDLDLSKDEIKRLGEALKDEKFRKLLCEYAEEISDPENRRRYEEEIAQMESERGMDVTFIRPEPGYVLKTSVDGDKKAFINISKSDKIDKPNAERKTNSDGKSGLLWHIPHSFAPPREDLDKQKNRCQVYDFVVHPDTYRMAEKNDRFQKLVEDTAIDGIERQFAVTLDRKNIKRPKMQFKGTPSATVIRHRSASGPQPVPDESGLLKDMPYPYDQKTTLDKMKERENQTKKNEKKKENGSATKDFRTSEDKDAATIPKYTIVHRSEIDMQEYRNAPDAKPSTRPRELVIKIELPLLKSAGQANLDIFEKRLLLESKAPAAYKLDLPLPYPVDDNEGTAKFDKQKRTLVITLPVIPDKMSTVPTFMNGDSTSDTTATEAEDCSLEKPLIEVLSEDVKEESHSLSKTKHSSSTNSASENEFRRNDLNQACGTIHDKQKFSPDIYTLPDFTFTQDAETVSFVLKVKNVSEESIKRTSSSVNEILLRCTSQGEGGFPLHYSFFLRFSQNCSVVPEHSSVDVTTENVVLLLLKERQCRGLWDHFMVGMDANALEERLFLTTSNLQQQLTELDNAAASVEQAPTSPSGDDVDLDGCSLFDLEVTAMDEKKLTIKISPGGNKEDSRPEEEEDEYDPPSSAEIEVVHTQPSPNLHGILKQRTVSESSEDCNFDLDSPRSPVELDEDELSSSFNSSSKRRTVSFSKHIDKATFKSTASVNSMKTALKSKRKRQRKWEEKKDKVSSRRRHNSTGSEGSCDDHSHSLSDSHSLSEEETLAGNEEDPRNLEGGDRQKQVGPGFRTKPSEGKAAVSDKPALSDKDSDVRDGLRQSKEEKKSGNTSLRDTDSSKAAKTEEGSIDIPPKQDSTEGNTEKGSSIAQKIKSKLAETAQENHHDDSDDEEEGNDKDGSTDANSSGQGVDSTAQPTYNEHRTECAFQFSNEVMFDLDVE